MTHFISEECVACGFCFEECPVEAIKEGEPYVIDEDKYTDCGTCSEVYPTEAIAQRWAGLQNWRRSKGLGKGVSTPEDCQFFFASLTTPRAPTSISPFWHNRHTPPIHDGGIDLQVRYAQ